jgi:hypothetical protein
VGRILESAAQRYGFSRKPVADKPAAEKTAVSEKPGAAPAPPPASAAG